MNTRPFSCATGLTQATIWLLLSLMPVISTGNDITRPNIVLMMVDDMGFSDLGCYGGEISTPNLDRLAGNGIRFTQFYNCAKCETTRSTLMSGKYYPEVGNGALKNCVTISEAMKLNGYRTIMTGKWHLESDPIDRGFDRYFGHLSGATNFFTGDDTFRLGKEKFSVPESGFYTTDANVDYALKFLQEDTSENSPFFLYIAFNAPHYPLQAPEEDVKKYIGKYSQGWDQLRQQRYARQKEMGLINNAKLTDRPADVPAWETLSEKEQKHEDLMMATYAAMIDRVDQNIGRLTEHLKKTGQLDNTLILFLSDNGACPFQRSKPATIKSQLDPWDPKSYWTYDKRWAHACNTPFREYKQNQHEGGITTPLIAHWPNGIRAELRNSITSTPGHLVDLMATSLDLAKLQVPETEQPEDPTGLRGISLAPIFAGKELNRTQPLFFSFYGKNNAVRDGRWKLVNKNFEQFALFDLELDRSETNDLAKEKPGQFRRLQVIRNKLFAEVGEKIKSKPKKKQSGKANKPKQK